MDEVIADVEWRMIGDALKKCHWNKIESSSRAAPEPARIGKEVETTSDYEMKRDLRSNSLGQQELARE
jgi:hypothetical protein